MTSDHIADAALHTGLAAVAVWQVLGLLVVKAAVESAL